MRLRVGGKEVTAGGPIAVADGRGISAGVGADGPAAGNMAAMPAEKLCFPKRRS